ncbi:MAG: HAD-IA family hydrolase [Planctomycetes bacterium]|nr:HAD-IA family hydrolase [Planctomycetota bacterium]
MKDAILMLDLGNVIFPLDFNEFDQWLVSCLKTPNDNLEKEFMPLYLGYEKGSFSTEVFLNRLREELNLEFNNEDFERKWISCWQRDMPGMAELLDERPSELPAYALSNTNELHMRHFHESKDILKKFDALFLSHEMKVSKPDSAIYHQVCAKLSCKPEQVYFFDDRSDNIASAKQCGYNAYIFESAEQIREILNF